MRDAPGTTGTEPDSSDTTRSDVGVGARELVVMISSIMALMALGIDLLLPGFDAIRETFGLGEGSNRTGQTITFYFFGLAIAQFVYGPLADRFGRKPVLYLGITIYIIGAVASALAPSFELLLAARVLWGIGAAGARVVATAIIRDRFVGEAMAKAMSQIMAVFILVPVVAPMFGELIVAVLPWQAMFWFCAIWAVGIAAWSTRLRETLDPAHVRPLSPGQIGRSYAEVARTPVTAGYTIATVFLQATMTGYLAVSELIIGDIYDRDAQFPLIFGAIAIGFGLSAMINGRLVERRGIDGMIRIGLSIGLVLAPLLVLLAVTSDGRPNFWLFMPGIGLVLASFMLLMPNLNTAAMTPVGHIAGAASAFTSAVRIGVGSLIASIATRAVTDSVTPFAVLMWVMGLCTAVTIFVVRRRAELRAT